MKQLKWKERARQDAKRNRHITSLEFMSIENRRTNTLIFK